MTQKALKLVQQLKHLAGKHPQKKHAGSSSGPTRGAGVGKLTPFSKGERVTFRSKGKKVTGTITDIVGGGKSYEVTSGRKIYTVPRTNMRRAQPGD